MSDKHIGEWVWRDLMTPDAAKAKDFYLKLFPEWRIEDVPMGDFTYYKIFVGDAAIGGMVQEPGIPPHWIAYVSVEDCDASVAQAESLGGKCCVPGFEVPDVGKFAVMNDPQGAVFKPFQLAKPKEGGNDTTSVGVFCWSELQTSDSAAAAEYYSKLFNWTITEHDMGEYGIYRLFHVGEKEIGGVMDIMPGVEARPHWVSYVNVEDVDASMARVLELGGSQLVPPGDIPDTGRYAIAADPSGAPFALFKGLEP